MQCLLLSYVCSLNCASTTFRSSCTNMSTDIWVTFIKNQKSSTFENIFIQPLDSRHRRIKPRSSVMALVIILFGVLVAPKFFPKLPFMMDNAATTSSASDFLGISSAILTVVSYGAPLEVIGKVHVIKTAQN